MRLSRRDEALPWQQQESLESSWCCPDVLSWAGEDEEEAGEELIPCPVSHRAVWE